MNAITFVHHSLDDGEVRKNLARGTDAIRQAVAQFGGQVPATKAAKSKKFQRRVRDAVVSLGRASAAAREAELKHARSQRRKRIFTAALGVAGIAGALIRPASKRARELFGNSGQPSEPQPEPPA